MKKSGTKIPRIELEEIGPLICFVLRRSKLASDDLFKRATRRPKELKVFKIFLKYILKQFVYFISQFQTKKVKNITKTAIGNKLGRIHMQRQDLRRFQTRKMKGLRKSPAQKKLDKKLKNLKRKKVATAGETKRNQHPKKQRISD